MVLLRRVERERERGESKTLIGLAVSYTPPPGDQAHNLGMCPDRALNLRPSGAGHDAHLTEPHQRELGDFLANQRDSNKAICCHKQEPKEPGGPQRGPGDQDVPGRMCAHLVFSKKSPPKPAGGQQRRVCSRLKRTVKGTRQLLMGKTGPVLPKS